MENDSSFIRKIYLQSLLPNVIAVLGGTVNVFFDGILVGQKLGEVGLASVSQSLPIYLMLCTIGSLFASGASFLSSIAFGSDDKQSGQRYFRACTLISAVVGLAFCALGLLFSAPLAGILSTAETYTSVLTYVRITLIGGVFKVLLYVPFFYLRLEGKNKRSASAMLTMTVLNIVLDYLFLFVFDFGIAGAAWASVIATAVACIMCFVYLFTDHSNFTPGFGFFKKKDWAMVLQYGSPMALNNVISSVRILLLNLILKSMGGGSVLIAIFAVINNINEFSICIQNGVPQTASAMTGIFFGEKDSDSVKKLLKVQLVSGTVLSAGFGLAVAVCSGVLGRLFGSTADCRIALICFAVSLLFATANSVMSYYYNATGQIRMANIITVCRGLVFTVLACLLFSRCGGWVWLFYPVAEIGTLLTVLLCGRFLAKRRSLSPFYLLDERFEASGRVTSFSVECTDAKICEASEKIRDFCEENEFSSKKTMAISLAIEEILTIVSQKSLFGQGKIDVRVLKSGDQAILRIRSGGRRYNPVEEQDDSLDYMGVQMITKMATGIEYLSSLGVNTLIIHL